MQAQTKSCQLDTWFYDLFNFTYRNDENNFPLMHCYHTNIEIKTKLTL